jgi:hypothetical protein
MKPMIRFACLAAFLMVFSPRPASACSCAMRPMPAAFEDADLIFTGLASVTPLGPGAQRVQFRVDEVFRGPRLRGVVIDAHGIGGSCAYAFQHRVRYFVFARRTFNGWRAFYCDPTSPLDQAGEAIRFARRGRP